MAAEDTPKAKTGWQRVFGGRFAAKPLKAEATAAQHPTCTSPL